MMAVAPNGGSRIARRAGLALWLAASLAGTAAWADDQGIGEIVVTAQKRSEKAQDVPVALTAFSASELQTLGFADPKALTAQAESLEIKGTNGQSNPNVFIRGIGSNDFNATASAAVGIYADEVYQGLQAGQLVQMFDLARVEVLRGPQGTLYGKNTTGGAINLISKRPDGTFGGDASVEYGTFNQLDLESAVQFPIVEDTLSARIAAVYRRSDGDQYNQYDGTRANGYESWAARVILRWTPDADQDWTLNLHASRLRGDGPRYHFVRVPNGAYPDSVLPLIGVDAPYTETGGFWSGSWDYPQTENLETAGFSLSGKIDLGGITLNTITGYENVKSYSRFDSDASPLDYVNVLYSDDNYEVSQELRLSSNTDAPFQWIGGLYFYADRVGGLNQFDIGEFARILFDQPPDINDPSAPINLFQNFVQTTNSEAAFGSASYKLSDALKLTGGIRWTRDEKKIVFRTWDDQGPGLGVIPLIDTALRREWNAVTGNAIIDYKVTPSALVYVSYNRGYKGGTFNGSAFFNPIEVSPVNPEEVNAYELGAKTAWLNNRLVVNVAAFYNDFSDLQVFRFYPDPVTGVPLSLLSNAGSATIKGIELELTAKPLPQLSVRLGAAYLDARYDQYVFAPPGEGVAPVDYSGNTLTAAPKWKINGVVEYVFDFEKFFLTPRVEFTYTGAQYFDPTENPLLYQSGYWVFNASLALEDTDGKYGIRMWAKNFANHKYNTDIIDLSNYGLDGAVRGAQRTFGVTMDYHF